MIRFESAVKEEILDLEPDELVKDDEDGDDAVGEDTVEDDAVEEDAVEEDVEVYDPVMHNFVFSVDEADDSLSDDTKCDVDKIETLLPGRHVGGLIDCSKKKIIFSKTNNFWKDKHASMFVLIHRPTVVEKEADTSMVVAVIPPRPPRLKAPHRTNESLQNYLALPAPETSEDCDQDDDSVNISTLADILNMMLEPPWKIINKLNHVQVIFPRSPTKPGCTVLISLPSKLDIYFNHERIPEGDPFWCKCLEEKFLEGQLRITYIIEVVHCLVEGGFSINSKEFTLNAIQSPRIRKKCTPKRIPANSEEDEPLDTPQLCGLAPRERKVTLYEIIDLMNKFSGQADKAVHDLEIELVKTYWPDLMDLLQEAINYGCNTNMRLAKMKIRYKRTFQLLEKWTEIIKKNPNMLCGVSPEETQAEWNENCLNDESTLRTELARNVKKIRTLRLCVKTFCPIFWRSLSMVSPKLDFTALGP